MRRPQEGRAAVVLLSERERECRGEDVSEGGPGGAEGVQKVTLKL